MTVQFGRIFVSMWLALIWLMAFMVHFLVTTAEPMAVQKISLVDRLVFLSSFIIHGLLDRFVFSIRTVFAFAAQFGFWWLIGALLILLYRHLSADKAAQRG